MRLESTLVDGKEELAFPDRHTFPEVNLLEYSLDARAQLHCFFRPGLADVFAIDRDGLFDYLLDDDRGWGGLNVGFGIAVHVVPEAEQFYRKVMSYIVYVDLDGA